LTPPSDAAPARAGTLAGWGRVPVVPGWEDRSEDLALVTADVPLTRGCGRAYGDASLPAPGDLRVAGSTLANRIVAFDPAAGELHAEAGLTLDEVYRIFLPRGFFTPVTPGTRFVTLGGMVACDVHGKNHHRDGCFGRHVTAIRMRVADGAIVDCSPTEHAELFWATIGGMGLTGHLLEISFRLVRVPSPWIYQETERVADIEKFIEALKTASPDWPMTVGWIDCLATGSAMGRGILYKGRWADPGEAPRRFPGLRPPVAIPFTLPSGLLTPSLMRALNGAYFAKHGVGKRSAVVHPREFFYPLDALGHWNRLYGRRGFAQYQCVLPEAGGPGSARRFLDLVTRIGGASFLCVIKDCGAEGAGMLSFPRPGISIALDLPMHPETQALVDRLNELVIKEGGRIYLAKDALTRGEHLRAMDPRIDGFLRVRRSWDPDGRFRSAQSVRVFGW
jgi:decaprenylphospho-beta-D-ribofuranose 2-oxidase